MGILTLMHCERSGGKAIVRGRGERLGQPVAHLGEKRQLRGQFARELALVEPPSPVAAMQAGSVHARLAAQSKHILQRNDAQARGRALRRADKRPMNSILAAPQISLGVAAFVLGRAGCHQPTTVSLSCVPV